MQFIMDHMMCNPTDWGNSDSDDSMVMIVASCIVTCFWLSKGSFQFPNQLQSGRDQRLVGRCSLAHWRWHLMLPDKGPELEPNVHCVCHELCLSCGAMPMNVANDWSSTLCRVPPQHDRVQYSGGDKHPKQFGVKPTPLHPGHCACRVYGL